MSLEERIAMIESQINRLGPALSELYGRQHALSSIICGLAAVTQKHPELKAVIESSLERGRVEQLNESQNEVATAGFDAQAEEIERAMQSVQSDSPRPHNPKHVD